MNPGIDGKEFTLTFSDDHGFKKGDILNNHRTQQLLVTKVYKNNLWRKIRFWLGFRVKLLGTVKVKYHEESKERDS